MNYQQYIKSGKWRRRKARYLKTHRVCSYCYSVNNLTVHHRDYKNFGNETQEDLQTLCIDCHNVVHHLRHTSYTCFRDKKSKKNFNGIRGIGL